MENLITLRVEFINKLYSGRRIVRETPSGKFYRYSGKNKKECIAQAKKRYNWGSSYSVTWETSKD